MIAEELLVVLTAAAPISEVRGAIPLAISFGFSPWMAIGLSVLGNVAIVVPLLLVMRYGSVWAKKHSVIIDRAFSWFFERTRKKYGTKFETAGVFALAIFVAIPLPMTGAWTACAISVIFGLPFWKSAGAIVLGVIVAATLVLLFTQGIIQLF